MTETLQWLMNSDEPWTRYRTLVDLLDQPKGAAEVEEARAQMLAHPQTRDLLIEASTRGEWSLKRHNDASHPIYKLSTLADFGLYAGDYQMQSILEIVVEHQSPEGAFQSVVNVPQGFGGTGEDLWTWLACDAPTLLYVLLAMGLGEDKRVQTAVDHLVGFSTEVGWRCAAAPELGKFKGPGRKSDPCPIANVYALKSLSLIPDLLDSPATHTGTEMLLNHWESPPGQKYFLFGVGSNFRKLKYPFVWYDILHVADVLSRFPFLRGDPRLHAMVEAIGLNADTDGRYTASSMYQSWKGWSFADKKNPSPWLTFLVFRIRKRLMGTLQSR
jgi:hypothetical protein